MITRRFDRPIVVGSGVAGLSVALASDGAVVLTRGDLALDGSSHWAQGGIAAAIGPDDAPAAHAADTIEVGAGLSDLAAVAALAEGGPDAIARLLDWGARFDRTADGEVLLGREAGHSTRRIVHADGDATGAEVMRTLRSVTMAHPDIDLLEHHALVDLVTDPDGAVVGVVADTGLGREVLVAPAVVLATGGYGRLWDRSTNPPFVTGDGLAAAVRVGAEVGDLEFVQFHPTALDAAPPGEDLGAPLLTEALRGEGATLVDDAGRRYMVDIHPDAELAPRDVVARATWVVRETGSGTWLDARLIGPSFPERFPTVFGHAAAVGLDPRVDLLPIAPAAHYTMGGVVTDDHGRTSLPGLFAVGEVAATGVHGGNRLASNSLLEGLVFGGRVARAIGRRSPGLREVLVPGGAETLPWGSGPAVAELRVLMARHAGVLRDAWGLERLLEWLDTNRAELASTVDGRNAHLLASLVVEAALLRTESRGAHHRVDHPMADPAMARRLTTHRPRVACLPVPVPVSV